MEEGTTEPKEKREKRVGVWRKTGNIGKKKREADENKKKRKEKRWAESRGVLHLNGFKIIIVIYTDVRVMMNRSVMQQ